MRHDWFFHFAVKHNEHFSTKLYQDFLHSEQWRLIFLLIKVIFWISTPWMYEKNIIIFTTSLYKRIKSKFDQGLPYNSINPCLLEEKMWIKGWENSTLNGWEINSNISNGDKSKWNMMMGKGRVLTEWSLQEGWLQVWDSSSGGVRTAAGCGRD